MDSKLCFINYTLFIVKQTVLKWKTMYRGVKNTYVEVRIYVFLPFSQDTYYFCPFH